jgi:tRNA-Thr(GGU) m(6)t(6)A37 methyltransferase TsaA
VRVLCGLCGLRRPESAVIEYSPLVTEIACEIWDEAACRTGALMALKRIETKPAAPTEARERLRPIGVIHSSLKTRRAAPKQGGEGAPDAWLEVRPSLAEGLDGIAVGDEIIVVTWLHQARRDVLKVHPRSDKRLPLAGVFATRSPDRPNPVGLHPVIVKRIAGNRLRIGPIEAIDRTPVIDIKPVLGSMCERDDCRQSLGQIAKERRQVAMRGDRL